MTNEEAVKIIKSECYIANLLNLDRTQMVNTALDMAIKALEQQPCEDCISREQAVYVASGYCEPQNIADELRKLPPVTSQPKVGHWVEMELVDTGVSKFSCSVCKEGDFYNQIDNPFIPTKYCPNCGADMRGDSK